jgi:hypothetical protein
VSTIHRTCLILAVLLLMPAIPGAQAQEEPPLTWVDCWMGDKAGTLSASQQTDCEAHYSHAPTHRLYDIRWVYLDVDERDVSDDWMNTQLDNLNAVFAPWNFQFQTKETVIIPDAVAESADYYEEWPLRDILPDLRAQLNLSDDEQTALSELKAELSARHVSQEELDNITLDEEYNTGAAFRLASRARSESITIVIRPSLDASGKSGGPSPEFQLSRGSAIELKSTLLNGDSLTTLPHEMGHFFGISHTHTLDHDGAEADFGFSQRWGRLAHDGEAIERVLGEDYSQPFGEPYVAYDASEQELIEHQELMGEAFIWPIWEFVYSGDHVKLNSLAELIQKGEAGETIYRINFERNYESSSDDPLEWWGMNCVWNSSAAEGQCRYSEAPMIRLNHEHPTLKDVIFFENGTVSNLMSYITPPYENISSRRGITDTQLDMIRFTANAPMRLLLRNNCLGTDLCDSTDPPDEPEPPDEEPDPDPGNDTGNLTDVGDGNDTGNQTDEGDENATGNQTGCQEGDTRPASDGCNTCSCDAEGNWACTEMACVDEDPPTGGLPALGLVLTLSILCCVAIATRRRIE